MGFVIFYCLFFSLAGWYIFGFSNDAKQIKTLLLPKIRKQKINVYKPSDSLLGNIQESNSYAGYISPLLPPPFPPSHPFIIYQNVHSYILGHIQRIPTAILFDK
jgi:hypothetical protein